MKRLLGCLHVVFESGEKEIERKAARMLLRTTSATHNVISTLQGSKKVTAHTRHSHRHIDEK